METVIEQVKNYLMKKYECHTIILYGSYAVGDYTSESDIDILGFSDLYNNINDTNKICGVQLDAWIVDSSHLKKPMEYLHILNNKVLLDLRGYSKNFLKEIEKIYANGKEPINDNQRKFLKSWLSKMYNRTLRNDAEGLYRYHWMLKDSLEIYFDLKNLWFLGVKKSLKWLETNEPDVYILFERAFRGPVGCNEAKELIDYILNM